MRGIREKHSRPRGGVRWAGGSRVHRGAPCCMLEALTQRTGGCHEHARPWWYCRSHRRHYPDLYRAPATRPYLETSQHLRQASGPWHTAGAFLCPRAVTGPGGAANSIVASLLEALGAFYGHTSAGSGAAVSTGPNPLQGHAVPSSHRALFADVALFQLAMLAGIGIPVWAMALPISTPLAALLAAPLWHAVT